jgi:hypothetical protein
VAAVSLLAVAGPAGAQTANLSSLHDALHLSAAQEAAWRTYVAAIAPDPSAAARRASAMRMIPTLTTPRRIDLMLAAMEQDLAAFHRQGEAVKAFYAQLSPDQQRVFDRQTLQLSSPPAGAEPGDR